MVFRWMSGDLRFVFVERSCEVILCFLEGIFGVLLLVV